MIALRHIATPALLAVLSGCGGAGDIAASGALARGIATSGNVSGSFSAPSQKGTLQIPFRLLRPKGDGPFPAIVIMHDCSGLGPRASGSPLRWARKLLADGYVIIIPDSFTPRGFPEGVCTNNRSRAASPFVRSGDALSALAHLRTLSYIDPAHIGLMGGSHGGSTTLAAMADARAGFAAAIAFYPNCGVTYGQWRVTRKIESERLILDFTGAYKPATPLLILIGEKDDWTPAAYCQELADAAKGAGYPVSIKVYPGALHAFDSHSKVTYNPERSNINKPDGRGATTGGDPIVWADAEQQVAAFFRTHLKDGT
jgi:dienelactone hydrolase